MMSDQSSELSEILKFNGDFKKNYGKLIGADLYLCSVKAVGKPCTSLPGALSRCLPASH